mgnify:CR=1 FL=1
MGLFTKVFGTYSQRELKSIYPIVDKITALEEDYKKLTDAQLQAKTPEFKERLANGETLDDILPEASDRVLGMRPYPVQLVGGIVLHQGRIAEMKTGEGKTLGLSDDACVYAVELEESYKLAPETPMNLVLQKDRVKVGEEYIVCLLTYPYVSRELKYYQESSKNSVFKPGDPALKAAMEDLYL